MEIFNSILQSNSMEAWTSACIYFIVSFGVLYMFRAFFLAKVQSLVGKTNSKLDDAIVSGVRAFRFRFYLGVSLWLGLTRLQFSDYTERVISVIITILVVVEIIHGIGVTLQKMKELQVSERPKEEQAQAGAMLGILQAIIMALLWISAGLLVLSNFGVNVTSFIASLGIGGIAIALALQNVLGDMFSSISIFMDKPFKVGDTITVGGNTGTVVNIGIKTTRIKLLRGEELVIGNSELTSTQVQNMSRLKRRRDVISIGVDYDTPIEKLDMIPGKIEKIFEKIEVATLDRCHMERLADYSINFEVVYFIEDSDYKLFMDKKQEFFKELIVEFAKEGIEFAFPTQVNIKK